VLISILQEFRFVFSLERNSKIKVNKKPLIFNK
jgi:hypothetical protein